MGWLRITSEVGEKDGRRRKEDGSGWCGGENNNEVVRNGMEIIGYV